MRETRPYGSEGGVARKRHPYPYRHLGEARVLPRIPIPLSPSPCMAQ